MRSSYPPKLWLAVVWVCGVLTVTACVCAGGSGGLFAGPIPLSPSATAQSSSPTPSSGIAKMPLLPTPISPAEASAPQLEVLEALEEAELPPRDRYDLALRFLGVSADPSGLANPSAYQVGDVASFWVDNDDTNSVVRVEAELVYMTPVVYMWVERGQSYDRDALAASADYFTNVIYPTNRSYFGSEPLPGIDGDPRLHILHSTQLGSGVAGYFYSPNQYPASVAPYSNEKEIFFINISNTPPGDLYYDTVLAHEFQHMIHWNVDRNEESWLNEGLSELAVYLNGMGESGFIPYFLYAPDLQLNDLAENDGGETYGASFLFTSYFLQRFGQDALRLLVSNPSNGLEGVDAVLDEIGAGVTAEQVFGDWVIANLLNDPSVPPGVYAYPELSDLFPVQASAEVYTFPASSSLLRVHQYGTDYINLYGPGRLNIYFEGSQQVRILPTSTLDTDGDPATQDAFVWWSNRGDESDTTLTRSFDLSGVTQAVLEYDVWYSIEEGWDYAYLTVSTDGGQTWTILPTPHTTESNPHGNAYGPGYTGESADQPGADAEGWLHESIDLSRYAGQNILVRFELITDDAVNLPGLAVDNICLRAVGFCDNAEQENGWEARGFVRQNNALPQRFLVQVVVRSADGTTQVLPIPLDETNRGSLTVTLDGAGPATLVVSAVTRYTTEPAVYRYEITVSE